MSRFWPCRTGRWPTNSTHSGRNRPPTYSEPKYSMKTIGVIGGGQLGLMIAEEAHRLGVRVVALDPAAEAPAFALWPDTEHAPGAHCTP
ncbi:MAG: hypothetical protein K2L09_00095, partial [Alistipes sp.]|nr:hypothetical protein [Alistipes sp.]